MQHQKSYSFHDTYLHSSDDGTNNGHGIMGITSNDSWKNFIEKENRVNIRYMIRYNNGSSVPWNRFPSSFYPMIAAVSKIKKKKSI